MSGKEQHWVLPYGVPAALLCEAILHANNMRDIDQDSLAGISTLATVTCAGGAGAAGGSGSDDDVSPESKILNSATRF